jgi:hypothetical protein
VTISNNIATEILSEGTYNSFWYGGGCGPLTEIGNTWDAAAQELLIPPPIKMPLLMIPPLAPEVRSSVSVLNANRPASLQVTVKLGCSTQKFANASCALDGRVARCQRFQYPATRWGRQTVPYKL